jgi:hypothetical protein
MSEPLKAADNRFGLADRRTPASASSRGGRILLIALIILMNLLPTPADASGSMRRSKNSRAVADAKTAVRQAIVYANDKGRYPTSIKVLREEGYANLDDRDPWVNDWVLSPLLTQGSKPKQGDDVYVYSKGPEGTGTYPTPEQFKSGRFERDGSAGYSSLHGEWKGASFSRFDLYVATGHGVIFAAFNGAVALGLLRLIMRLLPPRYSFKLSRRLKLLVFLTVFLVIMVTAIPKFLLAPRF